MPHYEIPQLSQPWSISGGGGVAAMGAASGSITGSGVLAIFSLTENGSGPKSAEAVFASSFGLESLLSSSIFRA